MKVLVQRVLYASVSVDNEETGCINNGLLLYVCFENQDSIDSIEMAVDKIINLRIFKDENQKMNQNILQIKGSILSISQFTLSWDGKKGHRPSFDKSMPPNQAKIFYRHFNDQIENHDIKISKGRFGSDMNVKSINDGPVTFFLEF